MTLHGDRVNIFGRSGSRISRRRAIGYGSLALAGALIGPSVVQPVAAQASAATPISSAILAWEEIDQQLAEVAPTTALLAAELIGDRIESIHETNADQALPIGSTFKLWILGALSLQVEAGTLDWEQMVEIQDAHRSVPGGDLRYVRAGSSFTLRYLAERMIQKSDNTATDHLLFLAGRENVDQAMATMGHSDPAHNIPLLSTRELEMLKFAYPQEQLDAYYAASVDERRRILAEEIAAIPY
ncbi:MAG TPA: serine hydrolase, partial [Thermomicrobiales bacterium]|nr:serine hydrolase [Thermomicrobiales bacterium]